MKFNWNVKKDVNHTSSEITTSVLFSSAFSTNCFGLVLNNTRTQYNVGRAQDITTTGYTLCTIRSSSGSNNTWTYYSLAYGY